MNHRTSIALISILKPVDDTRMFEKFGLSLGQTNKYEINIIGFKSKKIKKVENVHFYPIFDFPRLSLGRFLAPYRLFQYLVKVKPTIVIFSTPEIQHIIFLYKLFFGCKVIYDIQENYYRNIRYGRNYIKIFRYFFSNLVRMVEIAGSGYLDAVIYAEQGYRKELPNCLGKKATVIRNTYNNIFEEKVIKKNRKEDITLLFSGTIAESYGIFSAIQFIDLFHKKYPAVKLLIAGHCANKSVFKEVLLQIKNKPYIQLIGGSELVPHEDIIRLIQSVDFGLVCYNINPSIENCFPTKIYEYMANKLPMIVQDYYPWSSFCLKYNAAIEVNFENIDYDKLYAQLLKESFYTQDLPDEIFWQKDEKKLLGLIDDFLS